MSEHGAPASAPARPLYERVEQIRLKRGMSKVAMAQHLGLNRGTIDNWQRNSRTPEARTVKDVADRLQIDHDEALQLAGLIQRPARHLAAAPEADVDDSDQREYPAFVPDDELARHIWDGPGTEDLRRYLIEALQDFTQPSGGGTSARDERQRKPTRM